MLLNKRVRSARVCSQVLKKRFGQIIKTAHFSEESRLATELPRFSVYPDFGQL